MWLSLEASADLSIFSVPFRFDVEQIGPALRQGTSSSSTGRRFDAQSMRHILSGFE